MTAEVFVGRRDAVEKVLRIAADGSRKRIASVHGVPGIGKSTLLRRLESDGVPGFCCVSVDADALKSALTSNVTATDELARRLLHAIAWKLASCAPWWRRAWARRRAAGLGVRRDRIRTNVWVGAFHGTVSNSPPTVHIPGGGNTDRSGLLADLVRVTACLRRRRVLLMVDTTEWLRFFDDLIAEDPGAGHVLGVGAWFMNDVVDRLLQAAPGLRLVLAGTTALQVPARLKRTVTDVRLTEWAECDTAEYLAAFGLENPALARSVHQWCGGVPDLTGFVVTELVASPAGDPDGRLGRWISGAGGAADRGATVAKELLERLSTEQRRVLQAGAVLRTVSPGSVSALLRGDVQGDPGQGWYERFREHDFVTEITSSDARSAWWRESRARRRLAAPPPMLMLHGRVRAWLLRAMDVDDADVPRDQQRRRILHRRAVDYYTAMAEGFSTEAAYHSFLAGDLDLLAPWRDRLVAALAGGRLDEALLLADAAHTTEVESADGVRAAAAWAEHVRAVSALARGQIDEASEAVDRAERLDCRGPDGPPPVAVAVVAGQVAWRRGHRRLAAERWRRAVDHLAGLGPGLARAVRSALAEAQILTGDLDDGEESLRVARRDGTLRDGATGGLSPAEVGGPDLLGLLPTSLATLPAADQAWPTLEEYWFRLDGELASRRGDWDRARRCLEGALRETDDDPADASACCDGSAHAHRVAVRSALTRVALQTWDVPAAVEHSTNAGVTADQCPACHVVFLLAQAQVEQRLSNWTQPGSSRRRIVLIGDLDASMYDVTDAARRSNHRAAAARLTTTAVTIAHRAQRPDVLAAANDADGQHAEALTLYRSIGDRSGEANAQHGLADVALMLGRYDDATILYNQARTTYQEIGNRSGEANAQRGLADVALMLGRYDDAATLLTEARTTYQEIGARGGEAHAQRGLADVALMLGRYDDAATLLTEARTTNQEIGNRSGEANAQRGLADVALMLGRYDDAATLLTEARTTYQEIGDRDGEANALHGLAEVAQMLGRHDDATALFTQARTTYHEIGDRNGEANAQRGLAEVAQMLGRHNDATILYNQARTTYHEIGNRTGETQALLGLADVARMLGRHDDATILYNQARTTYHEIGNRTGETQALLGLAEVARDRGEAQESSALFTSAAELFHAVGREEAADHCRSQAHAGSPVDSLTPASGRGRGPSQLP